MSQQTAVQAAKKKGQELVKAMLDLVILTLLLAGAGFGGYMYGLHERLAPIQEVPPGTANALPPSAASAAPIKTASETKATSETTDKPATSSKGGKVKYWLASSGEDYIGYSIKATVNDNQIDSFFGGGKSLDITRYITSGDNTITFEAKELGKDYNKHKGDAKSVLTVQVIKAAHADDFKPSDVLVTYKRNAAEEEDFNDTEHFNAK